MPIDMKRRKRIISLSRGATNIKQFRAADVGHRKREREEFRKKAIAKGETPKDWAKAKKTPEKFREPAPGFTPVEQVAQAQAQPPVQAPPPSQLAAPALIAQGALAEGMVTPGLTAQEAQLQETPTPEGFAGDVAAGVALGTAGIALGVAALAPTALATTASLIATRGLAGSSVAKAASGKFVKETGKIIIGKTAVNSKNAGRIMTYLTKLTSHLVSPRMVANYVIGILATGLYTSFFWAPNEKGDSMTTLGIVQGNALRNEDYQSVLEIGEMMREANDIQANIPLVGFAQAEVSKFKAGMKASEVYTQEAERALAFAEGGKYVPSPEVLTKRAEADAYWNEIRESWK